MMSANHTTRVGTATDPVTAHQEGSGRVYLYEVQCLRTVAALMVAVYHIWFHRVSGGVDAFFVVAAFFMVSSLVRRDSFSPGDLGRYYVSTLRRVLPGTSFVIVSTILIVVLFFPKSLWADYLRHAVASFLFVENWWLAISGADYLQQDLMPSPFQQMWALALQMQFYLVFPVIIWLVFVISSLFSLDRRRVAGVAFLTVLVVSMVYSVYITSVNQPWAYFDSFARAWEFAAGAIVALLIAWVRMPVWLAKVLGFFSLLALLSFAAVIDVSTKFPGVVAIVPVLAASGIILSASNNARIWLLSNPLVVALGNISFSFYLWHWPLLILVRYWLESDDVGIIYGLLILLVSVGLAFFTTYVLEAPFRRWRFLHARPLLAFILSGFLMLPAGLAVVGWYKLHVKESSIARQSLARFLNDPENTRVRDGNYFPAPILARRDVPRSYGDGCHQTIPSPDVIECAYGVPGGDKTILLVGGSHTLQWLPVFEAIAADRNYAIINMTKSGCMLSLRDSEVDMLHESCLEWNDAAVSRISEIRPDLVFTIATRGNRRGGEYVPEGYLTAWEELGKNGINMLALRDNPWPWFEVGQCVEVNATDKSRCEFKRADALTEPSPLGNLALDNVEFSDFSDLFCDDIKCWPTQDNVLIYSDRHHVTKTFTLMNRDRVEEALDSAFRRFELEAP